MARNINMERTTKTKSPPKVMTMFDRWQADVAIEAELNRDKPPVRFFYHAEKKIDRWFVTAHSVKDGWHTTYKSNLTELRKHLGRQEVKAGWWSVIGEHLGETQPF